jgi:hypothetical protein
MAALPESFIELDGILVDRRIFTTHFVCDVVLQQCGSACCHRGCIITPEEIERLNSHRDGITDHLPEWKREFLRREGGQFVADPKRQPTDICLEEQWSMIRFFRSSDEMRCTWVVDDGCTFLYPAMVPAPNGSDQPREVQHCAIHSYAVNCGLDWKSFKPTDCVQYPLCVYRRDGYTILALQEEPGRARIPCLNNSIGPRMYQSLSGTITYLLGSAFNEQVQAYGRDQFPE